MIDMPGDHGIYNTDTITNHLTGNLTINASSNYGIRNGSNDFLNNHGSITITGASNFGTLKLKNAAAILIH